MAENDFLVRRRKQLAAQGRPDLAQSLQDSTTSEHPLSPVERRRTQLEFLDVFTSMLNTLTALRQTGYIPNPQTLRDHYDKIVRYSNTELFQAVFGTDDYHINEHPAFYSALVEVIKERDTLIVMQAGAPLWQVFKILDY